MIWLYRLLFPVVAVILGPGYLRTMCRRGGYWKTLGHRLGRLPRADRKGPGTPRVWLQAVSVGEMLAVEPILRGLKEAGAEIYLTTTTSTGYAVAADRYPKLVSRLACFPLDWLPFSARAWGRVRPDLVVLTEGERWPEHARQAQARGVRVVCINGRLSDRSYRRMRPVPAAGRFIMGGLSRVLAASEGDAARFVELGVPAGSVTTTGNIKLDVAMEPLGAEALGRLRADLGLAPGHLVLLGSSTWPGEEEELIEALRQAREAGLRCSLLLVPRHAERRAALSALLGKSGFSHHLRSAGACAGTVDVAVGDTTGELRVLTQVADVVAVGKSLPPHTEGQTPVEAAALGLPIVMGPGMANFAPIARDLAGRGAAVRVDGPAAYRQALVGLLGDADRRRALSEAARAWRRENAGAVGRTMDALREELALVRERESGRERRGQTR